MGISIGGYDLGKAWDESVGALRPQSGNYWKGKGVGKGTLGHWVDQIYGGTTKEVIEGMSPWGSKKEDDTSEVQAQSLASSEVDPEGELGPIQNIRKEKRGRKAANLSPASGASILTS